MKNILYILSLLLIVLSSCEKELEIKTSEDENKIVINSIVNPDSLFRAEITKTFSPYEKIIVQELENAQVAVYENDAFIENLSYHKSPDDSLGRFTGTFRPEIGSRYRIEVNEPNLGKARAEANIPARVNISQEKAVKIKWGEDNLTSIRFNFSFVLEDPVDEDHYFMTIEFPVFHVDTITRDTSFFEFQYCEIETGSLPLHQLYVCNGLIFNDKSFNGTNHIISGSATTYVHAFSENTHDVDWDDRDKTFYVDFSKMYIRFHHINYELYQFYSSHAKKLASENDLYSEPIPVYSNIENGYGIFGGENINLRQIVVEF